VYKKVTVILIRKRDNKVGCDQALCLKKVTVLLIRNRDNSKTDQKSLLLKDIYCPLQSSKDIPLWFAFFSNSLKPMGIGESEVENKLNRFG
jgi:hypothetical protein